ncbi:breast cancer metastasis-suppressor 1-like protein-A [Acropora muricata]|uniref:breast cancer metastasis-suppressor 1-like protein-A n=1 Tax=Acropora muricata TaxID=159855 RepID=UPI0034E43B15
MADVVGLVSVAELGQCNLDERCHGMVWVSIQLHNSNATVCHVNHRGLVLFGILEDASLFVCDVISRWLGLLDTDIWLESQSLNKRHRKSSDGSMLSDKRRKPVTVTGPYIVYMLREMDILEDWAAIRKAKGALARRRQESGCQSEKSPYSARYEDGKLYYEGEWFHKGDHVVIESRNDTHSSAFVTGINTGEVWVRKGDGSKTKLYIGQLQKGKYKIKKS